MIYIQEYKSPFGTLILGEFEGALCLCDWMYRKQRLSIDNRIKKGLQTEFEIKQTPLLTEVATQLKDYFSRETFRFSFPVLTIGTDFQKRVWKGLMDIPYGETKSYLELARALGDEKAIRAVATANGANALSIIIPCHRIIGSNGELTGYAGGLKAKEELLRLEGALDDSQLGLFV